MAMAGTLPLTTLSSASLYRGAEAQITRSGSVRSTGRNLLVKSSNGAFTGLKVSMAPSVSVARKGVAGEIWALNKREDQVVAFRELSDDQIENNVVDLKGELFVLRCKQATRQDYKSSDFRKLRKEIARMLTIRREREIEKGIKKRESRKLDREWKKSIVVRPAPSLASLGSK